MPAIAQQFSTTDAVVAEQEFSRLYADFTLQEARRSETFRYGQSVAGDENCTVASTDVGGELTATGEYQGMFSVVRLRSGSMRMWAGSEEADLSGPALARPGRLRSAHDHSDVLVANFTEAFVVGALRAYHGVDRVDLRYPSLSPGDPAGARMWEQTLGFVQRTVLVEGVVEVDAIRRSALRMLALVAVNTFCIETAMPAPPGTGSGAATVRRARVFMDENAERPITVEDVAAATHISVRGLQLAFRRVLGITPLEYLRRVRLDAARQELRAADPAMATVRSIALRTGFPHVGRFAAAYRDAYGELPSETLRL